MLHPFHELCQFVCLSDTSPVKVRGRNVPSDGFSQAPQRAPALLNFVNEGGGGHGLPRALSASEAVKKIYSLEWRRPAPRMNASCQEAGSVSSQLLGILSGSDDFTLFIFDKQFEFGLFPNFFFLCLCFFELLTGSNSPVHNLGPVHNGFP